MKKNLKYLYIGIAVIILLIYGVLTFFLVFSPKQQEQKITPTSTTPTPVKRDAPLEKIRQQQKQGAGLTQKETQMRDEWIENVTDMGRIYQTDTFSFYYLADYDTFQIRILSSDLEETKKEALQWLRDEGFSTNGICKLPILFYANPRLIPTTTTFTSIPEECE